LDIASILGLLLGWGLVLWAILSKSPLDAFIDPGSFAIVGGGAVAAAFMSFPLREVLGMFKVLKKYFFSKPEDPKQLIKNLVGYAEVARRDGILALEAVCKDIDDQFIVSGIQMAIDGTDPDLMQQVLESDLESVADRHSNGKAIFDNIGKFAPAFGMIGTLVGLVIMLGNLSDPDAIGPAMAVALLTTLYGSMFANMIALPIAEKLGKRSAEELMLKAMTIRGVMAIQSGDNPRIVEQKLLSFLPYSLRESEGEKAEAA
jgi:chemotaxis protein MotA